MEKPFYIDIPYTDPADLFAAHAETPYAQFLDSALYDGDQGRYSFIVMDPLDVFEDGENAFDRLKDCLAQYRFERHDDMPPFQGGAVGYFSYELLHQLEDIPALEKDALSTPDIRLGFYDTVAAFDHQTEQAWIFSLSGSEKASRLKEKLFNSPSPQTPFHPVEVNWQSDFDQDSYMAAVQQVIDYIHAGDIFQANLTQRFTAALPTDFSPYGFYQNLRAINPALFAAYLNFDGFSIASSSPERFLKLDQRKAETRPIKGTRPRHSDAEQDQQNATDLSQSAKDRAENTMIVDLLRNDLSKICKPHSVHVPELCAVHSFASVHHLVSTVTGEVEDDKTAIDLLASCFPGGSITGAPKVRAMEIISELEACPRGPYCGAIGYIGFDASMDTNIVIRTVVFKDNTAAAQVGGGIVADSDPLAEYNETLDKARALFDAFRRNA